MLGRYIVGTFLLLSGAMLMAPQKPEKSPPQFAATRAVPDWAVPVSGRLEGVTVTSAAPQQPLPDPAPERDFAPDIEAALVQALASEATAMEADGPAAPEALSGLSLDAAAVAEPPAPPPRVPLAPLAPVHFVNGTMVNLRTGPSTDHNIIGSLDYGEPVELITYVDQDWVLVRIADGETGYLARLFLAENLAGG
ncbi:MAG: SH3 domain-containing protein [Tropicimonas sp.]|uniref:SH3 domain-containing protein n=1 Tax=Tropicimonas sp. TaxID=2067044 RepID=UPI003A83B2BB